MFETLFKNIKKPVHRNNKIATAAFFSVESSKIWLCANNNVALVIYLTTFHSFFAGLVANTFEIKSTQLPLVALLLKTPELAHIIEDLDAQFGPDSQSPDFFDNDALVLDFSYLESPSLSQALPQLLTTLQHCRLKPIAFRNAVKAIAVKALACGLIEAPADMPRGKPVAQKKNTDKPVVESVREIVREVVREVPGPATLVIDKPLRSGQKVYARGADLVVLAMVNMGAEVVADGNIHVYAPLRGKAMAGASGNTQARIFSLCLEPELISIAGVYRTSENPLSKDIQGKPAQVRLSNDGQEKLLFEALNA
ncbi:septum site-determining protein MinC [Rhodoferax sp.]|uniref:septum site-determining protein MinC n=1 Tax=Rhodoferax sp. TaxID=50421 RepID=UPI000AB6BF05|nr:septum site-determining protein MinC [Rhodoferax sp.]MDO8317788.1 septum site-determining protein MinC [Rhodoferax sp.]MDP2677605.1 septum site-determining protein MinC [Rhodoferax sp.]